MTSRNTAGLIAIISMLFIDLLICQYQKTMDSKGILTCSPPNKLILRKVFSDTIKVHAPKNNSNGKK